MARLNLATYNGPTTESDCKNEEDFVNYYKYMMETDDMWLTRGVARIYANQTADEQAAGATVEDNGVGFAGGDASWGAEMGRAAQTALKYGRTLSPKQAASTRKFMHRYARQLVRIVRAARKASEA